MWQILTKFGAHRRYIQARVHKLIMKFLSQHFHTRQGMYKEAPIMLYCKAEVLSHDGSFSIHNLRNEIVTALHPIIPTHMSFTWPSTKITTLPSRRGKKKNLTWNLGQNCPWKMDSHEAHEWKYVRLRPPALAGSQTHKWRGSAKQEHVTSNAAQGPHKELQGAYHQLPWKVSKSSLYIIAIKHR